MENQPDATTSKLSGTAQKTNDVDLAKDSEGLSVSPCEQ
jgi:hypothetical protein